MVAFTKVAAAALLSSTVAAEGYILYHKDELTVLACTTILKKTALFFPKKDKKGYCNVKNPAALGSMSHCLKQMPHAGGIQSFIDSCAKYNLTETDFYDAYDNATDYLVTNTSLVDGFNLTEVFYYPVKIGQKKINGAYDSVLGRWYNYNRSNFYSWVLLAYWFVAVLVAGFARCTEYMFPRFVHSFNGKVSNAYRKYITMPATFRRKVKEHGSFLKFYTYIIPTRYELILLFIWFILALAFNVANYHHDLPNAIWKKESAEIGRKIGDRTGIISTYLIPQLVLFAGRNNFLMWISGWSYSRFNIIHHWHARITFLLMALHAVGMTYNGLGGGSYYTRNAEAYVQWGYVALIASAIMLFHSMAFVRKNSYETFVLSHNVLAAIFIAGTWIHIKEDGFQQTMYAATAIWGFDKVARVVRCFWFGVQTAEVQLIADETLKVKIPRNLRWSAHPMSHAYIYFFRSTCFWQSHPFTVVDSAIEEKTICFYIKVKGGMSHGLYKYLSTQPEQKANIKCTVEGPYGSRQPLQHYASAVFLSGGNGIPGLYAGALDLSKKTSTNQKIKLYWIIRHWKSVEWFYEELRRLEGTAVQPIVYVTQYNTPLDKAFTDKFEDDSSSGDEKKSEQESFDAVLREKLSFVEFREGRPNVEALIKEEIAELSGSTAFIACGHSSFVDESRKIVGSNLPEGKRVDFYDQMETW